MIKEVKPQTTAEQKNDSSPPTPSKGENNIPDEIMEYEDNFHNTHIDDDVTEEVLEW